MATAQRDVHVWPAAQFAFVDMATTDNTATKGDWLMRSGAQVLATNSATAYYRVSGVGIALSNNPTWNSQGSGVYLSAMPVGIGGTFHVSGIGSATAGFFAYPFRVGSGIVGQTGATGAGATWTAVVNNLPSVSALGGSQVSASAIPPSGIAQITRVVTGAGTNGTAQWEIQLIPPITLAYLVGGTVQL